MTGHMNGARDSGEPAASAACSLGARRTVKMSLQQSTAGLNQALRSTGGHTGAWEPSRVPPASAPGLMPLLQQLSGQPQGSLMIIEAAGVT